MTVRDLADRLHLTVDMERLTWPQGRGTCGPWAKRPQNRPKWAN